MSKQPNRVAEVNRYLRSLGRTERLVRGAGYYYFTGGNGLGWPSVMIFRASDLSIEQWKHEVDSRINEKEKE